MAVGNHSEALLLLTHRIAQLEIEMAGEILNFVAEIGEPALQRDALLA